MPIEVRELILKATVTESNGNESAPEPNNNSISNQEELIKTCVEKVLSIIKERHER